MLQYNLSDFQDVNEFLAKMSLKMGSLKKGGVPDINKAAQRVLSDWTNGKLTYFTEPPERTGEILSVELVTEMKAAFDIDGLLNNEDEQLKDLQNTPKTGISLPASAPTPAAMDLDQDESDDDEEGSLDQPMEDVDNDNENSQPTSKEQKKVGWKLSHRVVWAETRRVLSSRFALRSKWRIKSNVYRRRKLRIRSIKITITNCDDRSNDRISFDNRNSRKRRRIKRELVRRLTETFAELTQPFSHCRKIRFQSWRCTRFDHSTFNWQEFDRWFIQFSNRFCLETVVFWLFFLCWIIKKEKKNIWPVDFFCSLLWSAKKSNEERERTISSWLIGS